MPVDHKIRNGECVSSVAFEKGFFWETLWNHGNNSELKNNRKDPNVLREGDILHVPDLTLKEESKPVEKKHRFRLKGVPAKLRLRLMKDKEEELKDDAPAGDASDESAYEDPETEEKAREQEPRKDVPYILEIDGVVKAQGQTDAEGRIEVPLPPNANQGKLTLNPGKPEQEVIPLQLGGLDPIDEISGVRRRLSNLGHKCVPDGDEMSSDLQDALMEFQGKNGLEVSGEVTDETKDKLKELHGA